MQQTQAAQSRWTSPLVVAIIAASLAGFGSAAVALINGRQQRVNQDSINSAQLKVQGENASLQRESEEKGARLQRELVKNNAALQRELEAAKAESDLILEVIKTGDPERAAVNLKFLLDTHLISNPQRVGGIQHYLRHRRPGTGIALPAGSNFVVEGAGATPEITKSFTNALIPFRIHLISSGLPDNIPFGKIRVDPNLQNPPSYYLPDEQLVVVSSKASKDNLFPLAEYMMHVLEKTFNNRVSTSDIATLSLAYGVRDFLVASYLNDPQLGLRYKSIYGFDLPSLQLSVRRTYGPLSANSEAHEVGAVWASAFWAMRESVGVEEIEGLIVEAWLGMPKGLRDADVPEAYSKSLLAKARSTLSADKSSAIEQIMRDRRLPGV